MIEFNNELSVRKQATILDISRSKIYYKPIITDDGEIANLISEIYLSSDCRYGYRKITAALHQLGNIINNKKVIRIMRQIGIEGLYPKKYTHTTIKNNEHKIYPYLLTNLEITKANQVWASDITYISMGDYFMYFVAIIDLYSRYIVSYDLSHSLDASFCISALTEGLEKQQPEIFNTDQGCQFTSSDFIKELTNKQIKIIMDHKGRCFDNIFVERLWRTIKQEVIYYYKPECIRSLEKYLKDFVIYYNNQRPASIFKI